MPFSFYFFFCSLPSLSLSLSLSVSLPPGPRRPRPRSPPDNLPFLLQILNTCCPTALSRRDMCSLLPGSFACALAEVCIRPGPAADPTIAPILASSCLVPAPRALWLCVSCARSAAGLPPGPRPRCATRLHPAQYICTRCSPTSARAYIGIVSENPCRARGRRRHHTVVLAAGVREREGEVLAQIWDAQGAWGHEDSVAAPGCPGPCHPVLSPSRDEGPSFSGVFGEPQGSASTPRFPLLQCNL